MSLGSITHGNLRPGGTIPSVTTQRGEDTGIAVPPEDEWFTHPDARMPGDDDGAQPARPAAPGSPRDGAAHHRAPDGVYLRAPNGAAHHRAPDGVYLGAPNGAVRDGAVRDGAAWEGVAGAAGPDRRGYEPRDTRSTSGPADSGRWGGPDEPADVVPRPAGEGRHQWSADTVADPTAETRGDGFDPGDTGTWRVRDVVPGQEGGRRTTTILRYLLGLLAVDNVRKLTRFAFVVPVLGALLLIVRPRWIGAAVLVLGLLLVVGRIAAVRLIVRRSLARRYRPVEDDLRAAVEAGKANLRGELRRAGLPSSSWSIPLSVVRLGKSTDRSKARSRLLEIEIDRVLPRAQLDRALKVLDEAAPGR